MLTGEKNMLTQKRLRSVLTYDPETGIFTWAHGAKKGKIAGTLHDDRGFLKVSIDGKRHFLTRLAWLWMTGEMPTFYINHRDGDRSNNRFSNLRLGERMQTATHCGPRRDATGIVGVWSVGDQFEATIDVSGVTWSLGKFATSGAAQDAITLAIRRGRESQRRKLLLAATQCNI
jgi:hypothetical protein